MVASSSIKLTSANKEQCDGIMCQLGCCPYEDYVCCKMPGKSMLFLCLFHRPGPRSSGRFAALTLVGPALIAACNKVMSTTSGQTPILLTRYSCSCQTYLIRAHGPPGGLQHLRQSARHLSQHAIKSCLQPAARHQSCSPDILFLVKHTLSEVMLG